MPLTSGIEHGPILPGRRLQRRMCVGSSSCAARGCCCSGGRSELPRGRSSCSCCRWACGDSLWVFSAGCFPPCVLFPLPPHPARTPACTHAHAHPAVFCSHNTHSLTHTRSLAAPRSGPPRLIFSIPGPDQCRQRPPHSSFTYTQIAHTHTHARARARVLHPSVQLPISIARALFAVRASSRAAWAAE